MNASRTWREPEPSAPAPPPAPPPLWPPPPYPSSLADCSESRLAALGLHGHDEASAVLQAHQEKAVLVGYHAGDLVRPVEDIDHGVGHRIAIFVDRLARDVVLVHQRDRGGLRRRQHLLVGGIHLYWQAAQLGLGSGGETDLQGCTRRHVRGEGALAGGRRDRSHAGAEDLQPQIVFQGRARRAEDPAVDLCLVEREPDGCSDALPVGQVVSPDGLGAFPDGPAVERIRRGHRPAEHAGGLILEADVLLPGVQRPLQRNRLAGVRL